VSSSTVWGDHPPFTSPRSSRTDRTCGTRRFPQLVPFCRLFEGVRAHGCSSNSVRWDWNTFAPVVKTNIVLLQPAPAVAFDKNHVGLVKDS
jgi:hypothetical protein